MTVIIVPTSSPSSKSHTGAIAGGAAGGIVALAAAIIIFLFCWRRRRRDEFDGNFDPGRIVRSAGDAGHTDLAGAVVTPYNYEPPSSALSGPTSPTFSADSSMQQYRDSQGLLGSTHGGAGVATASSSSQYAPTSSEGLRASSPPGKSSHARSNSYGSTGLAPGPGFPVAQPYRPLSSKEQERLRQRGDGGPELGLASLSAAEEGESNIIQHSDGGRITDDTEPELPSRPPQEIPPSYYSIPGNPY